MVTRFVLVLSLTLNAVLLMVAPNANAPRNPVIARKTTWGKVVNTALYGEVMQATYILHFADGSTAEVSPQEYKRLKVGDRYEW